MSTSIVFVDYRRTIALALNVFISFIAWNRRHYLLDRKIYPLCRHQVYSLAYTIFAGCLWWISTIAVDEQILLQLAAGFVATIMSWYGLVIIVNHRTGPVSRRQVVSLLYYIVTDVCVQLQTRLLLANIGQVNATAVDAP